ncbi:hypothetical protein J4727_15715 [Providencia rettgeri]|uniref:Uncharacterized protein n=1 Tax=Providencia rettgeri TaxID=587 RepID=A0A939SRK3_PRORE|nr:hypothetical protein [Providencia rettgeri]
MQKSKILGYYDQLAAIGSKDYTRKLAHQYLNGNQHLSLIDKKHVSITLKQEAGQ